MKMRSSHRFAVSLLSITLMGSAAATAEPALVGKLSCSAEVAPQASDDRVKDESGWKLSCAFEQTTATAIQHYSGEITGLDQAERTAGTAGKALLVWSVLAAAPAPSTVNLVGVYKTSTDAGLPAQALIGGRDQTIILQPISDGEQTLAPAVRLIKLDLPKA